jgi:hypothetical protein
MRKSRQPRGGCGERMQDSPRFPFPRLSFCEDRKTSLANAEALLRCPLARRQRPADLPSERIRATRAGRDDSSGAGRGLGFWHFRVAWAAWRPEVSRAGGESRAGMACPAGPALQSPESRGFWPPKRRRRRTLWTKGVRGCQGTGTAAVNAFPVLAPADRVSWVDRRGDAYKVTHR